MNKITLILLLLFFVTRPSFAEKSEENSEERAESKTFTPKVGPLLEQTSQRDWTLLAYESQFGPIRTNSLRRFGDYRKVNLRALRALRFHLKDFDFGGADLRGADFTHADVRGANFRGSDLSGAVFLSTKEEGAIYDSSTKLPFPPETAHERGWILKE